MDDRAAALRVLVEARAEEKKARSLRREGRDKEAIEAFEQARERYADSDLAWDGVDSALADEVKSAMERCNKIASNLRSPKEQRARAVSPRPDCLACHKALRRFKFNNMVFGDGTPREWGGKGDNRFCGLTCGHRWACRNAPMPKVSAP